MDELLNLVKHVQKSVILAELGISKLHTEIYYIDGMSSPKGRRLLNLLCEYPKTYTLQVGSWKGSTLISSLYGNEKSVDKAISIDNFCEFDKPLFTNSLNFEESITHNPNVALSCDPVEKQLKINICKYLSALWNIDDKLEILEADCFNDSILQSLKLHCRGKVNMYFYDGNHSEESQYRAFTEYHDVFADKFIALVDDWNDSSAEIGTRNAIRDLGYKIHYEQILPSRYNGDIWQWWQGLGLFVLEK